MYKQFFIRVNGTREDSLDRLIDAGEQFAAVQKSVESTVLSGLMVEELHEALDKLPESERNLIHALFFQDMTEQEYADSLGIKQQSVNERKLRILAKLKNILRN
ncbi:MAG: sigma-70 family RNA polymerase sigma factor [Oscillospiraceae bacterium]|nr:sigma-70 family RNA polymerase sigma factor [Oscillospiraceae bacterium]